MNRNVVTAQSLNEQVNGMDGELMPVRVNNNEIIVDSLELHRRLRVGSEHRHWIRRRISEYGFEEGKDFFVEKFSVSNLIRKTGSGGQKTPYFLTLDMAKELAIVERNEIGRKIRRYFIEVEKRYRDWIGFVLPKLEQDIDLFSSRMGYNYEQLLNSIGASTKKSAMRSRIDRNRQEFWKNLYGNWYVSEEFGKNIILYQLARNQSKIIRGRNIEYRYQKMLEGGVL